MEDATTLMSDVEWIGGTRLVQLRMEYLR